MRKKRYRILRLKTAKGHEKFVSIYCECHNGQGPMPAITNATLFRELETLPWHYVCLDCEEKDRVDIPT